MDSSWVLDISSASFVINELGYSIEYNIFYLIEPTKFLFEVILIKCGSHNLGSNYSPKSTQYPNTSSEASVARSRVP